MPANSQSLIAIDIGNSRMKIGRFDGSTNVAMLEGSSPQPQESASLPEPTAIVGLPIDNRSGNFDVGRFTAWCSENVADDAVWFAASVHRAASDALTAAVGKLAVRRESERGVRWLTYRGVSLPIQVDEPQRVGIDRLLAAVAADRLREPGRAAIVVDLGTAITVDLLTAEGAFAGGAILPGIAMSARALAEQTDALPQLELDNLEAPPVALGKSTSGAIEAGLYWGAVGAVRELVARLSAGLPQPAEIFLTGGASSHVAEILGRNQPVRHVPHLVLSGIALVADGSP